MNGRRGGGAWILAAACVAALAAPAAAVQGSRKGADYEPPAEVDPYTEGDPGAMHAAGYVSFGPFPFGDGHDTARVEEVLGRPVLWVETAHFRLGSTLWEYRVADDRDEKRKLKEELARLRERLPAVPRRARDLDPWLRLHLYALRLEETYAAFQADFGVADEDFPSLETARRLAGAGSRATRRGAARRHPMGDGPHLGMPGKFTVLLTEKASTLGRYTGHFLGSQSHVTWRHWFPESGALFVGTAAELLEGPYENDTALHCSVVFALAQNLVDGFRGYVIETPLWLKEGLGHVHVRRVDPRYPVFSGTDSSAQRRKRDEDWEPKVRGRVEHEYFPRALETFAWADPDALDLGDHLTAWSRVDFLVRADPSAAQAFLSVLKDPPPAPDRLPTREELVQRQVDAVRRAWDVDPAGFDAAWSAWVLREYDRR